MMDDYTSRAFRSARGMTFGRLATQAMLLISAFVIPRVLGLETFGLYAALMAVVAMLDSFATGGLQMAEIRFFAPAWRQADKGPAVRLASTIWLSRLVLSGTAGLLAIVWLTVFSSLPIEVRIAVLVGLVVAIRSALEATRHLFLSIGQAGRMAAFEFLRAALTLILVVLVFEWLGELTGVFAALPIAYLALLVGAVWILLRTVPLRVSLFDWSALRPALRFSGLTLLGSLAWAVQAQFATFAVANWVSLGEGALVALTIQIYVLFQTLIVSVRSSLLPILAEMEAAGSVRRIRMWGGVMMRWGAAGTTTAALVWSLVGESVLRLLPAEFAPVYRSGAVIMLGVIAMACAVAANGLLYVSGNAGWASFNRILFAGVTVIGVAILLAAETTGTASDVAWVYALAALVFFAASYGSLMIVRGMRLPLRRTLALAAPAALAWPAVNWDGGWALKLLALALVLVAYGAYAVGLRLLPREELKRIRAAVRGSTYNSPPPLDS
jgi:O-antigen/teichoic acid export membrane protein